MDPCSSVNLCAGIKWQCRFASRYKVGAFMGQFGPFAGCRRQFVKNHRASERAPGLPGQTVSWKSLG